MKKIKELFMTSPSIKHTFNYHLSSTYKCNFLGADNKQ